MVKISQLSSLTTPNGNDEVPIVDTLAGTTKKITLEDIRDILMPPVGTVQKYYGTKSTFNSDSSRHGWLFIERATTYSKTTYQRLYDHLKAVDASSVRDDSGSTFRFATKWFGTVGVSLDPNQTEFNTLGKNVGAKNVQLGVDNYQFGTWRATAGTDDNLNVKFNLGTTYGIMSKYNTNNNEPVNIIQPSLVLNYIIKY